MTEVFISATNRDLAAYVQAVDQSLRNAGYQVVTMSSFGAQPDEPRRASIQEVEKADYFLGLYARRYGYIPESETLAITEQEYHHARLKKIPVFAFLVDEANTDLAPGPGEDDASDNAQEKQAKLKSFLTHIETALVRETFAGIEDLKTKVLASLSRYEKRKTILHLPVNTLRIRFSQKQIELFHNDQPIGSSKAEFDAFWRHALEDYKRAKSSCPSILSKNRSGQPAGAVQIMTERIGKRLGDMVFASSTGQATDNLIKDWQTLGEKSQIALQTAAIPWSQLPLETMMLPGQDQPLALMPHIDLFRMVADEAKRPCPDIDGPLKVLMAVAAPWKGATGAVLDYEKELGRVMDIVERLPNFSRSERRPIVHILDQSTLEDICDAFQHNRYHILHISCHGQPGSLNLEKEDGTVDTVTAADLVSRFPVGRQPVLTVLSACHTGMVGELTSFAENLVRSGFSYVMAMQEGISDPYATGFTETLYRNLAYNEDPIIEDAFTQARIRCETSRIDKNRSLPPEQHALPEWMVPALYKGNVDRHSIYEARVERYNRQMEPPVESFDPGIAHRQIGEFVGRRRELLTIKNEVLAVNKGGTAIVTGMGGVGKSTLVARALANTIRKGESFQLFQVIGRISLVDLLQGLGCKGTELKLMFNDFFNQWLPEHGSQTVFLFDNFEENLFSPAALVSESIDDKGLKIVDPTTARFLADLIYAGKTRTLITSRYPFQLPDRQHWTVKQIELGALSLAETRKLMDRLAGFETLDPKLRHQVARYIGGHPRTLEFLDAILRDGRFTYLDVERRLMKKLPEEALDLFQKQEDLSLSLRQAAAVAVRDCFVDQLLELLSVTEKELLFFFSVFQEPRPLATLEWLQARRKLEGDCKSALKKLNRLSLITSYSDRFAVHRWTAEYLKEIMGESLWQEANRLAGDHFYKQREISLEDSLAGWQHYLESGELEISHAVAIILESKLHIWGHWDLRRIVCETMLEKTQNHLSLHASWLRTAGVLNEEQGDHDGARRLWQKSLEISENIGDQSGIASSYHKLGIIRQSQGDIGGALQLYQKSLDIFKKLGDQRGMAASYHQLGTTLRDQGDYDGARRQHKKSLGISEKLGDQHSIANSYHHLGMIQQYQGDFSGALQLFQNSLEIKEKLGDRHGAAITYHHLGMILQENYKYDEAIKLYQNSLEIKEKLGDQSGMAITFNNLGAIHRAQGDHNGARRLWQKSLEISENIGDQSGIACSYHQLGILLIDQGDYDGALQFHQKSHEIFQNLGDQRLMASSYHQLGLLMHEFGRDAEAFRACLQGVIIFSRLRDPYVNKALNYLCKIICANPDQWHEWLAEIVADEEVRLQIKEIISQSLEAEENQ
jgi:tetratricopeptide (TPR) repeat protein